MVSSTRIVEVSLADMAAGLARGEATSESLTQACLVRIAEVDPKINSVLALNPRVVDDSRAADERRKAGRSLGSLDGVPILIKDNIDTAGLATTAGSLALAENMPRADAAVVQSLRAAGLVILGKANLSEWSNIRSGRSTSGWSAVGGLTRNPYDLARSACGSSSGSAAAVAASLVPAAVGTETDGSVVWPASMCGVVGMKPTLGLISQQGVIPISAEQDTPGPLARSVRDTAMLLTAMCGGINYADGLDSSSLKGLRLGAVRSGKFSNDTLAVFERALETLRGQGAEIVDIDAPDTARINEHLLSVLLTEFKAGINAYLATAHPNVKSRTLADLIAFNRATPRELEWFGQEFFEMAQTCGGVDAADYRAKRALIRDLAGAQGIDRMLRENHVTALLAPTNDPAWSIALGQGDVYGGSSSMLPAIAGYPNLTVPAGYIGSLPVGLSIIGTAWTEKILLSIGFAFEQAAKARRAPVIA